MAARPQPDALARIPTVFQVGAHQVSVLVGTDWIWTCSVDTLPLEGRFLTQVEAWEAGVREAARRDRAPVP
jgi:hypothetical protein